MRGVTHYMQKDGTSSAIDIEAQFDGLKYSRCEGLEARGKRKNVYTEEYADSDELRVWMDENGVTREATTLTFTFYFIGDNRQKVFDEFYEYVKNGKICYWDTKRLKKAYMFLKEDFAPSEDIYYGSVPYKEAKVKFQNMWGECKTCDKNGNVI